MRNARRFTLLAACWLAAAGPLTAQDQVVHLDGVNAGTPSSTPVTVTVSYTTRGPADDTLTGLGLRLHWDSGELAFTGLGSVLLPALTAQGAPEPDLLDLDGDSATDTFIHLAWADPDGEWTGIGTTPQILYTADFVTAAGFTGPATLGLSASSTAAGYSLVPSAIFRDGFETGDTSAWSAAAGVAALPPLGLAGHPPNGADGPTGVLVALAGEPPSLAGLDIPLLDVDGDDLTDPATDGTLVLRYLFGFRGTTLVDGALGAGATRTAPADVEDYLDSIAAALDIDLDGRLDALTDGLLVVRFLAGVVGEALTEGVLGPDAGRTDPAEVLGYLDVLADPEGAGDTDGDGLSDLQEVVGYPILIDFDGLGVSSLGWIESLTERWVTSDPVVVDTDGDGLDDYRERLFRTDPEDPDTDDDDLGDLTELERYASAPASVDSDGDSRGSAGTGFPNPAFFDGNELALFGTSPALADTDGDARSDFDEINQNATPPLVADVPKLAVELVGDLFVDLQYSLTTGEESRQTNSKLVGQSDTSGQSTTDSTSSQWSIGASATVTAGVEAGFPGGATASASVSATVSSEYSEETTASFTEDSSTTVQEEFQESEETALSMSEEITGGSLSAGINIRNTGDVAFTLSDLAVTALLRDPDDRQRFQAVATLIPALPGGEVTLGPFNGETGVLEVTDPDISTGLATSLLADPSSLFLDVATFSLEDAEGRNFAFLAEVTNARTALVTLDFGNGDVERYRVATLVERNPDGTGAGVSVDQVMTDILGIPYATEPRSGSADPLYPNGVQLLTRVRDVETSIDPDPAAYSNDFWAVLSNEPTITGQPGEPYTTDFGDIVLHSGDAISLTYVSDDDRDGLFRREEFLYKTLDTPRDFNGDEVIDPAEEARTFDFDEDGLDDFAEVRTGWQVRVGPTLRLVHPDPTRADSDQFDRDPPDGIGDGDGLSDLAEFRGRDGCGPHHPADPTQPDPACGLAADSEDATDPTRSDTDGDGLDDAEDDDPLDSLNTPPVIALIPDFDAATGILNLSGAVTDATDPIDRVIVDWGDGEAECLANGAVGCDPVDFDAIDVTHQYLLSGEFTVTVTASDVRAAPGEPAEDSETYGPFTVVFPDDPEALFFFDSGSLADVSGNGHDGTLKESAAYAHVTIDRLGNAADAYCLRQNSPDSCAWIQLDHVPFDDQFSFVAWILRDNPAGMIVGQWNPATGTSGTAARLRFSGSSITFEIDDGSVSGAVTDPTSPPSQSASDASQCAAVSTLSDWRLFIGTVAYDGSDTTLRLYRGSGGGSTVTLIDEQVLTGEHFQNPSTTDLTQIGGGLDGSETDCSGANYTGRIDDVRIYDRALSLPEMNALLNEVR